VEGIRGGLDLLAGESRLKLRFALISPRLEDTELGRELRDGLEGTGVPVEEASDQELENLSGTERTQGVLLVAWEPPDPDLLGGRGGAQRLLILDGIQDPGNVGTLIRAAFAFGMEGVITLDGTVDPYNAKVVRAAAGALANVPVARMRWDETADDLDAAGIPILVADPAGEDVRGMDLPPPWALVIGNEGAGPRPEVKRRAHRTLGIRMAPGADSLNAGVAGAILLFALSRIRDDLED
jgi:TrmH family RNA methyltransferase